MLIYDGLVKRKAYLVAIMEGLDSFKMKRVMCSNPKLFEPLFIGEPVSSARVKEAIKTLTPPGEDSIKQRILHTIGIYLDSCDEKGMHIIVNTQINGIEVIEFRLIIFKENQKPSGIFFFLSEAMLGIVHNFQPFCKCTKSTLFLTPPPSPKRTV